MTYDPTESKASWRKYQVDLVSHNITHFLAPRQALHHDVATAFKLAYDCAADVGATEDQFEAIYANLVTSISIRLGEPASANS